MATITGLQLFDLVFAMTDGGPIFHTESIVMYLYEKGFVEFQMGYASAIAWVLFAIILAISAVQLRLSRGTAMSTDTAQARRAPQRPRVRPSANQGWLEAAGRCCGWPGGAAGHCPGW